jgi:hypothetical protein
MQKLDYFLLWGVFIFFMMQFGCGVRDMACRALDTLDLPAGTQRRRHCAEMVEHGRTKEGF